METNLFIRDNRETVHIRSGCSGNRRAALAVCVAPWLGGERESLIDGDHKLKRDPVMGSGLTSYSCRL